MTFELQMLLWSAVLCLVQMVLAATARHSIDWRRVKGHSGHAENDRADRLACDAAAVQAGSKVRR